MIDRLRARGSRILDTRTEREFSGKDVRAIRGGQIASMQPRLRELEAALQSNPAP